MPCFCIDAYARFHEQAHETEEPDRSWNRSKCGLQHVGSGYDGIKKRSKNQRVVRRENFRLKTGEMKLMSPSGLALAMQEAAWFAG